MGGGVDDLVLRVEIEEHQPVLEAGAAKVERRIVLRLSDGAGSYLAGHQVGCHGNEELTGLLDVPRYLFDRYGSMPGRVQEQDALDRLGDYLGATVLGSEIMRRITGSGGERRLMIEIVPGGDVSFSAGLACVPWEHARAGGASLVQHGVSVCVRPSALAAGGVHGR